VVVLVGFCKVVEPVVLVTLEATLQAKETMAGHQMSHLVALVAVALRKLEPRLQAVKMAAMAVLEPQVLLPERQ
jgi:hypothetical protein